MLFRSPPGGGRRKRFIKKSMRQTISIHALRVEGDRVILYGWRCWIISIHALRVEGDKLTKLLEGKQRAFLSTPSGWRATGRVKITGVRWSISIHALRVEGDHHYGCRSNPLYISIHALRVEGDPGKDNVAAHRAISIHALRVEGDPEGRGLIFGGPISIHALRVEGDRSSAQYPLCFRYFYPRPPGGGRPIFAPHDRYSVDISIHALRVEGDIRNDGNHAEILISIHALRVEGDAGAHRLQGRRAISIDRKSVV